MATFITPVNFHYAALASEITGSLSQYSPVEFQYTFETFFHPFVGDLIAKLNQGSVADMLDPAFLSGLSRDYSAYYTFTEQSSDEFTFVDVNMPAAGVDVAVGGPYAVYNWELLYHIPVMIAVHLSQHQRFAEAEKWFHLVFDPTFTDSGSNPAYPFWKFLGFRQPGLAESLVDILSYSGGDPDQVKLRQQVLDGYTALLTTPFAPHLVARSRPLAYMYYVVMKYLDNLIAWGDSLFLQNTTETINEARVCYVLAANLAGPRPQQLPARGTAQPMSYSQLKQAGMDAMGDAIVDLEVQFPFNSSQPSSPGSGGDGGGVLLGVARTLYFCFPPNQTLLAYWDIIADRLFKIRHCESITGAVEQLPLFDAPLDPGMLVKAAAAGIDIGTIVSGLNQPAGPLRSLPLIQKAMEVANEVRSFGSALLSAYEKGDNEHLAVLRQANDLAVQTKTQTVRFLQWKQAQEATQALLRTRATTLERYTYYLRLLGQTPDGNTVPAFDTSNTAELTEDTFDSVYQALVGQYDRAITLQQYPDLQLVGVSSPAAQSGAAGTGQLYLNSSEDEELNQDLPRARDFRQWASIASATASGVSAIPWLYMDVLPMGGGAHSKLTGGDVIASIIRIGADVLQMYAGLNQDAAGMAARKASHQRRADEWLLQANLAARELMQIGRQVIASLIAEQVAQHDCTVAQAQVTQAQAVLGYLQNQDAQNPRFTTEQLYSWMQGQLTSLYYQYYRLAFDTARKAEQTMKQELMRPELDQTTFVQFNYWNTGNQGLLSGEALHLDLKRMELAYHDNNKRELELTRHVSLRQLNPLALLALRTTGQCTFTVPEWFFDRECPGHYMRRIKNVALSLLPLTGPYTSVNCTLTLQSSSIRTSSLLRNNAYARQGGDDDRFTVYFGASDQIVTSTGSNDSGMFETNLHEDRFLPFEGAGAANSTWTLQLPQAFRPFDYTTITDAILHLRYTARPAGDPLASQATTELGTAFRQAGTAGLALLFILSSDFPTEWAAFTNSTAPNPAFTFALRKDYFPYFVQDMTVTLGTPSLHPADPSVTPSHPDFPGQATADLNDAVKGYTAEISLPADSVLTTDAKQVYLIIPYSAKAT